MSEENVEIVRRAFELGVKAGAPYFELFDPDVLLENVAESPITGPYRGHEGLRRWREDIEEVVEDLELSVAELRDLGNGLVFGVPRITGRARHSGIEADFTWAGLWHVEGGRIRKATGYQTKAEALEAAGLRE
jgi:ketosteroid isomerase-like protein